MGKGKSPLPYVLSSGNTVSDRCTYIVTNKTTKILTLFATAFPALQE